jgi:hypothetical protein
MYNLKIEALKIISELKDNKYEACLVGNYPFVKYHNSIHADDKLKIKQFSIITNATLDDIKKLFKVTKVFENSYNKCALIEILLKQNLVYFKIYYAADYTNVINNKVKSVDTIDKILNEFSFLLETITIDENSKLVNYTNKKLDAFQSIEEKALQVNGNFREKIMENPLIMLELCYYASNMNYSINSSLLKIISNNNGYLRYELLSNIVKYFNMILMSKHPLEGIKIIKDHMIDFKYNDIEIFKFLEKIPNDYINELSKFDSSIDIISRWAYLLKPINTEAVEIINNFQLNYKNKILWLLQNFELIQEENYKMAIYNSKETFKMITEAKGDIFLLYEMFDKLTKIHSKLNPTLEVKCGKIIDAIYSRPFFDYQLKYDDKELCEIANVEAGDWLQITKENLVQKILMCDKHPDEEEYLEMTKESIEYGLISSI